MQELPGTASSLAAPLYVQHISEAEYITLSRYDNVFYNFYTYYTGPLMNIETVLKSEKMDLNEGPAANQLAVAKILKAYYFRFMTDRWGDLPYSQSLKAKENFTPAYDTQQSIYNALFALLEEANATIEPGKVSNDIMYEGNMEKWRRLGNTLRLLMALRLSKVDPGKGQAEFNKALTAGIMRSNEDNLMYQHKANPDNANPWYTIFETDNRKWYAVSQPLVDYMKPVGDPRLATFAAPNAAGDHVGLKYGLQPSQVNEGEYKKANISLLGEAVRQASSPTYLVTYAQALFALAEAAKLGWIPGGDAEAESYYKQAIEASVKQWNNGDISGVAYMLEQPEIKYNPARAIEQISKQRWVHLFLNGYEAWAEWRRTGYPQLQAPTENNSRQIPRREAYPVQEAQNNSLHYNQAVQRQFDGVNDLNGRVWWDK